MSERKVLNKYYPPDFDPSKIPRLKRSRNRQFNIRIMAPFNMRCSSCGDYIYKGKKFNSRQETVEDEDYLGLRIFRFYIKCPRCVSEITFKTDPEKTDYTLEGGATRNFEAAKTAELLAQKALKEQEERELNNPMKVLEDRTRASRQEMDNLETLQDLKELNTRNARLSHAQLIQLHGAYTENLTRLQADEDEAFVESLFGKSKDSGSVKRLHDDDDNEDDRSCEDDDDDSTTLTVKKMKSVDKPTSILTESGASSKRAGVTAAASSWQKSVGGLSRKASLGLLVRRKQTTKGEASSGPPSTGLPSMGPPSMGPPSTGPLSMGPPSTGLPSMGPPSVGPPSTGLPSMGPPSVGPQSMGPPSMGPPCTGPPFTGPGSSGPPSSGPPSTGPPSTGPKSTGPLSSGPPSSGPPSTGPLSTGPPSSGAPSTGPESSVQSSMTAKPSVIEAMPKGAAEVVASPAKAPGSTTAATTAPALTPAMAPASTPAAPSALGMLGCYSDSDNSNYSDYSD